VAQALVSQAVKLEDGHHRWQRLRSGSGCAHGFLRLDKWNMSDPCNALPHSHDQAVLLPRCTPVPFE
jgi:hypothetical protein